MAPFSEMRTMNVVSSVSGPLDIEYERTSSVPGTLMFTYWPGRKASSSRLGMSMPKEIVESEWRSIMSTLPLKVTAEVLATSEVEGMLIDMSDSGVDWQVGR